MKRITQEELNKKIKLHHFWLKNQKKGQRLNLGYYDLYGLNFVDTNLWGATFENSNLKNANFEGADLYIADLSKADLTGANLLKANLSRTDLSRANLSKANLSYTRLYKANLEKANLTGANLLEAFLKDANLENTILPNYAIYPLEGAFIGFKKVQNDIVLKLEILNDSKRLGGLISRKCRTDKVKVLEAFDLKGNKIEKQEFVAMKDENFKYKIGEIAEVLDFNEDIREKCTRGIHFFMSFEEARDYNYC